MAEPVNPEKLALAREVFQIMNLKQLIDNMNVMMTAMTQNLAAKLPDAQQQKLTGLRKAMNEEMQASFIPKLLDQMAVAYAKTFSAEELRGILAFYKSPTGVALISKTPTLLQALMPSMVNDVPDLLRASIGRYCAENTCTPEEHTAFDKTLAAMPGAHG